MRHAPIARHCCDSTCLDGAQCPQIAFCIRPAAPALPGASLPSPVPCETPPGVAITHYRLSRRARFKRFLEDLAAFLEPVLARYCGF